jgi:hypothetical protein
MKKVLLAGGAGLVRLSLILVVVGIACFLAPSSFAQNSYTLTFQGMPSGSVALMDYIGLDRKLKTNVAGQTLNISVSPGLTTPKRVRLSIVVSATGSSVTECNATIATAQTVVFEITGNGRALGASDFTGSSGIGIQSSTENQPCIDALSDKMQSGVAAIPTGIYMIDATLNDAATGAILGSGSHSITVASASTTEAVLNLTSPANGEQVPQSASVVFSFDNSIPGRLLAFEHSTISQSPDDATRDLNSSLKILDLEVTSIGTNQVVATSPGNALRPWMANKKVSWLFLGRQTGSAETRKSPVWSFMIVPSDPTYDQLARALANAPSPIGTTYSTLISSGYLLSYSASNPVYIQGGATGTRQTLDVSALLTILANLGDTSVQVSVVER